jgi:hypothetical protein
MMTCCVPLPSATSPGHCMSIAQFRPSRLVSLKFPSSMWPHITVSQCPWVDFAPNWHGQPQAQLQFVNSVPRSVHRSATGLSPASSELSLDFDDHGAVLSRAADVLDRVFDLIKRVGSGNIEFCG